MDKDVTAAGGADAAFPVDGQGLTPEKSLIENVKSNVDEAISQLKTRLAQFTEETRTRQLSPEEATQKGHKPGVTVVVMHRSSYVRAEVSFLTKKIKELEAFKNGISEEASANMYTARGVARSAQKMISKTAEDLMRRNVRNAAGAKTAFQLQERAVVIKGLVASTKASSPSVASAHKAQAAVAPAMHALAAVLTGRAKPTSPTPSQATASKVHALKPGSAHVAAPQQAQARTAVGPELQAFEKSLEAARNATTRWESLDYTGQAQAATAKMTKSITDWETPLKQAIETDQELAGFPKIRKDRLVALARKAGAMRTRVEAAISHLRTQMTQIADDTREEMQAAMDRGRSRFLTLCSQRDAGKITVKQFEKQKAKIAESVTKEVYAAQAKGVKDSLKIAQQAFEASEYYWGDGLVECTQLTGRFQSRRQYAWAGDFQSTMGKIQSQRTAEATIFERVKKQTEHLESSDFGLPQLFDFAADLRAKEVGRRQVTKENGRHEKNKRFENIRFGAPFLTEVGVNVTKHLPSI